MIFFKLIKVKKIIVWLKHVIWIYLIYLKQVYTFQSNQVKFENPKSSLPLKRFIVCFLTTLNSRKPKVRWKCISGILLILTFTTTNLLQVCYVNIASYETLGSLRKNKDIAVTKPDNGNGVVILDRKLHNNAIEEIISETSKFEKLNEDPMLKREALLQRFFT